MHRTHVVPVFGCLECIRERDRKTPTLEQVLEQDLTRLLDTTRNLTDEEWLAEISAMYEFYVDEGWLNG